MKPIPWYSSWSYSGSNNLNIRRRKRTHTMASATTKSNLFQNYILSIIFFLLLIPTPSLAAPKVKVDDFGDPTKDSDDPFAEADKDDKKKADKKKINDGTVDIPKNQKNCNGIYLAYTFISREKIYPLTKNVSGQAWAFSSMIDIVNMGKTELKMWQAYVGFQYRELIVSIDGAQMLDATGYPAQVSKNGTVIAGYPKTDLETAIDTANDMTQMSSQVTIKGTQFGLKNGKTPMPKKFRLANPGFKCPRGKKTKSTIQMCCHRDPKYKEKKEKKMPRRFGDLNIMYDVLQAYGNNYQAQVTINNDHPLGRLDHWNLTWEWQRGEFIYSMRGAFTHIRNPSACLNGPAGNYYQDFDFSQVTSCEKEPIISDLPREMKDDKQVGKLPYCCRNGTLLPKMMNESESISIFQMQVFKTPPDLNRTAIYPPQNWRITGVVNPHYKCGPPIRVDPTEFPDPRGLSSVHLAVASWEIVCNITKPKPRQSRCCVTFSSYFNDSVIPCNTCACGCKDNPPKLKCSEKAPSMLLPPEAVLVPYANRTKKAKAWARINHLPVWNPMPCPDNCGVSINWHLDSDHQNGWTARITLFNWGEVPFENWFAAAEFKKKTALGFEKAYSFNGTLLKKPKGTVFLEGLKGLNYLIAETNGSNPGDPRVPGKQQTVISFKNRLNWNLNIAGGDGFPKKIFFNGEECALPRDIPRMSHAEHSMIINHLPGVVVSSLVTLFLLIIG